MSSPAPVIVVAPDERPSPPFLLRALYFVFIGSWLSLFWLVAAWLFVLLVITLPLGLVMINALPRILTLRARRRHMTVHARDGVVTVTLSSQQRPFLLRAVWFILIGFWLSFIWTILAWAVGLTVLGLPLALAMFDRVPFITTLARY